MRHCCYFRFSSLLLLLPVFTAGLSVAQEERPLAVITDLDGGVRVSRTDAGNPLAADFGMPLFRGDRVTTLAQARVSIMFPHQYMFELGPESTITIANGAGSGDGDVLVGEEHSELLADLTLRRTPFGDLAALGGLRSASGYAGEEKITPIGPRNTAILGGRPVFVWEDARELGSYRVSVLDAGGPVWSGETTDTRLAYPGEAPPLRPGARYLWKVEGDDGLAIVASETVGFEVLPEAEADSVRAEEASIRALVGGEESAGNHDYLVGVLYARHGLLSDAIASFSRIAERHPEAAAVHEMLGTLYQDVDLKDKALDALNRALSLRQ